ncbi:MAG TPA: hypothetical protein VF398_11085, partial [bacterium]
MKKQAYALLAALVLLTVPAFGQGWNVDLVSTSYGGWSAARYIVANGNYAYVNLQGGDIAVVDVSNPANPVEVNRWDSGDMNSTNCQEVAGNYLYVNFGWDGWGILDISNPVDPVLAVRFPALGGHFCFVGNTAYLGSFSNLYTYDNTDPLNPIMLGQFHLDDYAADVEVSGDYAYISYVNADGGVRVIDVSDPANPVGISFVPLPGNTADLAVSGNYVFVTCCWFGMYVIDVSDPAHPLVAARFYPNYGWYDHLRMSGNIIFLATSGGQTFSVDVSQPTNPQLLCSYQPPGTNLMLYDMDLDGSRLYGAYDYHGIKIIEASNPQNLQLMSSYEPDWILRDVAYQEGYVFIAAEDEGLLIQDVSDPENPFQIGYLDSIDNCINVILMDDYAYLQTYSDTTMIVDISDPVHPSVGGSFNLEGTLQKIQDNLAYAGGYENIMILDMASPLNPVRLGVFYLHLANFGDLDTDGRFLYAIATFAGIDWSAADSLLVLDVNDPANPQFLGMYPLGGWYSCESHLLAMGDGFLCVTREGDNLRIFNISDPTQVVQVGQLTMTIAPSDLVVVGDFAYLASVGYQGIGPRIIDVSDPACPMLVGYYMESAGYYLHLAVHEDYIYANKSTQFVIYDCSDATHNDVEVSIVPFVQPIQIPASGGSFDFYLFADNSGPGSQTIDLWTKVILPNGSSLSPLLGPVSVSLDSGTIGWIRHQNVPERAAAGLYTYIACAGDYPNSIWASDSLQFTKLATRD